MRFAIVLAAGVIATGMLAAGLSGLASAEDDLRTRFIAATTDASGPDGAIFSQEQAGCVFDRFSGKTDAVRTLGLVLAMEGQQRGAPDVAFMIRNQASYDEAAKACGAEQ